MNLPNALTLARIFFVPLLVAVLVQRGATMHIMGRAFTSEILAAGIFLAAACTDLLDGYLARRWSQITTVGTLLDPIADKLLISSALIALVEVRALPAWMTIIIVGREFAISGLRSIAAAEGYVIQASDMGKLKLVTQVLAITLVILSIQWSYLYPFAMAGMWLVVLFTLASAFSYFHKFWGRVDERVKRRHRRSLMSQRRALLRKPAAIPE